MQFLKSSLVEKCNETFLLLIENVGDWSIWGANQVLWGDHPSRKKAASEVGILLLSST